MKIEVNISKKYAFAIIGLLVVLIVGGFVYASHTTDASVNHGITQITGIPECTASQVLTHRSGGGVVCVADVSTGVTNLYSTPLEQFSYAATLQTRAISGSHAFCALSQVNVVNSRCTVSNSGTSWSFQVVTGAGGSAQCGAVCFG